MSADRLLRWLTFIGVTTWRAAQEPGGPLVFTIYGTAVSHGLPPDVIICNGQTYRPATRSKEDAVLIDEIRRYQAIAEETGLSMDVVMWFAQPKGLRGDFPTW